MHTRFAMTHIAYTRSRTQEKTSARKFCPDVIVPLERLTFNRNHLLQWIPYSSTYDNSYVLKTLRNVNATICLAGQG